MEMIVLLCKQFIWTFFCA